MSPRVGSPHHHASDLTHPPATNVRQRTPVSASRDQFETRPKYFSRWAPYRMPSTFAPDDFSATINQARPSRKGTGHTDPFVDYLHGKTMLTQAERAARIRLVDELRRVSLYSDPRFSACTPLSQISDPLSLTLDERYAALTELPPLPLLKLLKLKNLPLIKTLPENLKLLGGLHVSHCHILKTVPATLSVRGDVTFIDCPKLSAFPANIANSGSLILRGRFPALCLPSALRVYKDFEVSDDPTRIRLFDRETKPRFGSLVLRRMNGLKILNLPHDMLGSLSIDECGALNSLQDHLKVGQYVSIKNCPKLRKLGFRVEVRDDLTILNCLNLETICEKLWVGGNLTLERLPHFRVLIQSGDSSRNIFLPKNDDLFSSTDASWVRKSITISQAPKFQGFSEKLRIGEDLKVIGCKNIQSLPISLFGWPETAQTQRRVTLTHTGIDWASTCERLTRLVPRATVIFQSTPQNVDSLYNVSQVARRNLPNMVKFFHKEADALLSRRTKRSLQWLTLLLPNQKEDLKLFLQKLLSAEDLRSSPQLTGQGAPSAFVRNRQHLILRTSAFLDRLSELSTEWDELFSEISHAVGGCVDRVMQSFGHCEQFLLVHDALRSQTHREQKLLELAGGLFRLDLVHQWAFRELKELYLRPEESCELMLFLECALRVSLKLPVHNFTMKHGSVAGNLHGVAERALKEVSALATLPGEFERFLAVWEPWQKYKRQILCSRIHFGFLPLIACSEKVVEGICPLTLEPREKLKNPVALPFEGTHHIFELDDLLTWWTQSPKHPLFLSPLPDLAGLVRLR